MNKNGMEIEFETLTLGYQRLAGFIKDLVGSPDTDLADEVWDQVLRFHQESVKDLGDGNVGTLVEVHWDRSTVTPVFSLSSYPLN